MAEITNLIYYLIMKHFGKFICKSSNLVTGFFDRLAPIAMLLNRYYLAKIFMWSGWLKITSWSSTVYMFANDFKTGFLSPKMAALLGTSCEIILPFLLLLGLGGRLPALLLFIFNVISVFSYPMLLEPENFCALKDHILWGVLILIPVLYGPGKISLDYVIQKKLCKEYKY